MDNTYPEPMTKDITYSRSRPPDAFVDQTPSHVLQRERFLDRFELAAELSTPTYATYSPFVALRDNAQVASYLAPFGGFAADLRLRIQLTGNSATYGLIQISWFYGEEDSTGVSNDANEYLNRITTANTYFLDASSSESLEFTVPFLFPRSYFPAREFQKYMTLIIANRGTYTATGGAGFPSIDIFANYENISTHILTKSTIVNENAENRIIPTQGVMTVGGALLAGKMVYDSFTSTMQEFNTAASNLRQTVDQVRQTAGTIGTAAGEVGTFVHQTVTSAGDFFSQPSTTAGGHGPVKQSFYGDISTPSYEYGNNLLDITQPTKLVTIVPNENTSLERLCSIPSLVGQQLWTSESPIGTARTVGIAMCPDIAGLLSSQATWGCYISKNFRLVSYDTVLILHFRLTPLTSARFRISTNYATESVTGDYDIPSEIILVKGSMDVPIYIPYVNINPLVEPSTELARVIVELVEAPKKVAGTSINLPMWVSISHRNVKMCSPQAFVVEQSELRVMHDMVGPKPHMSLSSVPSHLTEVRSLDTLFRRYDEDQVAVTDPVIVYPVNKQIFSGLPNYQKLALPFAYYTGSKEVKVRTTAPVDLTTPTTVGFALQNSNLNQSRIADGQTLTDPRVWPVVECVIPYISNIPFQAVKKSIQYDINARVFGATPVGFEPSTTTILSRAGPDFSVGFANVLPGVNLWL